jgi:PhoH-like ATPase
VKYKTFVIDTNVLLYDPDAIYKFPRHNVVIPVTVLEELDKMKRLPNELGRNSRAIIRSLDALKTKGEGNLHVGVRLENDATIRIRLKRILNIVFRSL